MKLALSAEMRDIDRRVIEDFGLPGVVLMENAGLSVLHAIGQIITDDSADSDNKDCYRGKYFVILCGPGNNGGDGFVIGRHLYNLGAGVTAVLLTSPERYKGDALVNYRAYKALTEKTDSMDQKYSAFITFTCDGDKDVAVLREALSKADIVIDAIFGTGFTGELPGYVQQLSEEVSQYSNRILSVDIPTGVDADTGKVSKGAFKADLTVTFALSKPGLEVYPGKGFAGKVKRAYIGIPDTILRSDNLKYNILTLEEAREMLPKRPPTAHKGTFGKTLVVAGSPGMTGAAYLTSTGALLTGSGLVTLCIPHSLNSIMEVKTTEVMTIPCSETADGTFSKAASLAIIDQMQTSTAVAIGPGLGRNLELSALLDAIIESCSLPVLIDADGLYNLKIASLSRLRDKGVIPVLTPHPGEMARLTGLGIGEIESDRIRVALKYAEEWNSVVLLKGAATVIAEPGGMIYINTTGNQGMASGGAGDVLSGIIGGLLAQGISPFDSAVLGAYIHGLTGDLALPECGMASLTAGALLRYIPKAFQLISLEGSAAR